MPEGEQRPITRLLADAAGIDPGEGRLAALLFLLSFCTGLTRVLIVAGAAPLYIEAYGASALPYMYVTTAVLVPLAGMLHLRMSRALSFFGSQSLSIAVLLGAELCVWWLLVALPTDWPTIVAMVLVEVVWIIGLVVFWAVTTRVLDVRQAKRLSGLVSTGEVLAVVLCGAAMPILVQTMGTRNLLAAAAVGQVGVLLFLAAIRASVTHTESPDSTEHVSDASGRGTLGYLRDPYVRIPFAIVAFAFAGYYFADAAFFQAAQAHLPDAEKLAGFYGLVLAVVGAVTLLSKVLLTGRAFRALGLGGALIAPPLAVAVPLLLIVGAYLLGASPLWIFWLATALKIVERVVWDFLGRPAYMMLYQPVPSADRGPAQTIAESQVAQVAGGLAGVTLVVLFKILGLGIGAACAVLLVLLGAWLVFARKGANAYPEKLAETLLQRGMQGANLPLQDPDTLAILEQRLRSENGAEVVYCLSLISRAEHPAFPELLLGLLAHDDPEVRRVALEAMGRGARSEDTEALLAHLRVEQDSSALAAAMHATSASGGVHVLSDLSPYLEHEHRDVRAAAIAAIVRRCGIPGAVRAGKVLLDLLASPRSEDRALAAAAIGETGIATFALDLRPLLTDESIEVRAAALKAAGELGDADLWPVVVESLENPQLRLPAVVALLAGGDDALACLEGSLQESSPQQLPHVVAVLGRFRSDEAAAILVTLLEKSQGAQLRQVLAALHHCGFSATGEIGTQVRRLIDNELSRLASTLAATCDLDEDADASLRDALDLEGRRILEGIFLLLSFLYSPGTVNRIWANWREGSPRRRAFAIELLDNIFQEPSRDVLLAALADLSPADRLRRMAKRFPQTSLPRAERVAAMAQATEGWLSPWTQLVALEQWNRMEASAAAPILESLRHHEAPLVALGVAELLGEQDETLSVLGRVRLLSEASIFARVPADHLADVAQEVEVMRCSAGENLFEKGSLGTTLYIVVSGAMRIHIGDDELAVLGAGSMLGELSAFDPEPRSASVTATEDSVLLALGRERMFDLVTEHREVGTAIMEVLCERAQPPGQASDVDPATLRSESAGDGATPAQTMSLMEKVIALKTSAFFRASSDDVLAEVASMAQEFTLPTGQRLFSDGEMGDTMYIVVSGLVDVHKGEQSFVQLGKNTIVGEMAVLASAPRSASVTALEDSRLLAFSKERLDEILYTEASVARAILEELVRRVRARLAWQREQEQADKDQD